MASLRTAVLVLFIIGAAGTAIDLVLIGHYEDSWQLAPLVLLGTSALVGIGAAMAPAAFPVRAFQVMALLMVATGAIGLWLHWRANNEFEREMSPNLGGLAFVLKAMRGASPPSAAPGTLIHLGMLGLAFAWRHPALTKGDDQ
jgi:hypothetical protein